MEPNQAAEHLQAIRTLMERSALYRRALAPVMIYCGIVGIIGGVVGGLFAFTSGREFVLYWTAVAVLALTGSFFLIRRQALKDSEPFWSPPTRRVAQALSPAFALGAAIALIQAWEGNAGDWYLILVPAWCILFGLGIHSAGFFMPRGLTLFGWIFIITGSSLVVWLERYNTLPETFQLSHWLMGGIFGGLHLAYGIYLYFTEKRGKAS